MKSEPPTYRSYLLRLRYYDDEGRRSWRISLEEPGSGKQISFNSLDDLHNFLAALMAEAGGRATQEVDRG